MYFWNVLRLSKVVKESVGLMASVLVFNKRERIRLFLHECIISNLDRQTTALPAYVRPCYWDEEKKSRELENLKKIAAAAAVATT